MWYLPSAFVVTVKSALGKLCPMAFLAITYMWYVVTGFSPAIVALVSTLDTTTFFALSSGHFSEKEVKSYT